MSSGAQGPWTDFDRQLLACIQQSVPLVREPFAQIAQALGADLTGLLERIEVLRSQEGPIRRISGIFDLAALGYRQALVAFRVPPAEIEHAGQTAAAHPGVSHCYARSDPYNLWFTLATSPQSRSGLSGTAEVLAGQCRAADVLVLPAIRRYKLDVRPALLATPGAPAPPRSVKAGASPPALTDQQQRATRALQMDLPGRQDPFSTVAEAAGLDADDLLVHATDFLTAGWMRRYAAQLRHRKAGAQANVMVVWQASPAAGDAAGTHCAQIPEVSHCYLRKTHPNWPYGLYTMVHGRDRAHCRKVIERIAAATALGPRKELWTEREFKKEAVKLFDGQEARWEAEHLS